MSQHTNGVSKRDWCRHMTRAAGVATLVLAAGLASCERSHPDQRAIENANTRLESLSVAGANASRNPVGRGKAFREIIKNLQSATASTDVGRSQAATLLTARANAGLGEIEADRAADQEHQFLSKITVTRALLDQWMSQQSVAAALSTYDPASDLAKLDAEIAQRNTEARQLEGEKAQQEAKVRGILGNAEQARTAAKADRDREAGIRKRTEGVSQTVREDLIRQAVAASREGDAKDKQASELAAEAAKESPKVEEIGNQVERLHRQVESLNKAKTDITKSAQAAHQQADQARQDASAVGIAISRAMEDLAKIREASAAPTQEAVAKYSAAATGANKASSTPVREAKTAAFTVLGACKQSIGDLLASKARSLAVYASTLNAVAQAQPAVPDSAKAASAAAAAATELDATLKDAKAAYAEAKSAYDRAGGSGDVKTKLDAVKKALDDLEKARENPGAAPKPAAPDSEAKPAAAAPSTETPSATGAGADENKAIEAEVRAALKELQGALLAGDFGKIRAHMLFKSEAERQAMESLLPVMMSAKKLDDACKAKFGKDLAGLAQDTKVPAIKANPMFSMLTPVMGKGPAGMMDPDAADKAAVRVVSKTEAEATLAGEPKPEKLVKDKGVWKVTSGDDDAGAGAQVIGAMGPIVKAMGGAFDTVAGNITADKYATADDMLTDLSAQLMGAMGGAMGGPGGGGVKRPKPAPGGGGDKPPPPGGGG